MANVWTDERVERLKQLWAEGFSAAAIAYDLGCFEGRREGGRSAVIGKIHRLKLPQPAWKAPYVERQKQEPLPRGEMAARRRPLAGRQLLRRNPSHNILTAIADAAEAPCLSERLKGEAPDGTGIQVRDLADDNCHWPKGDPKEADFEFCGRAAFQGLPYCARHCALAYRLPEPRRADKMIG